MDDLYDKTEKLLKSLLSIKTGASKDLMVPALKAPTLKAPKLSVKQPSVGKIPSGLPPPSKKDPVKVAQQLKNPNPEKVKVEVLKAESNGQWSLEKVALDPSHGITFQHEHHDLGGIGDLTHIKAIHPVHGEIGSTLMEHRSDGTLEPQLVNVNPNFRRMGIASAMYSHAQNLHNKKVVPSRDQTPAGQALWAGNKANPQFGKDEGTWKDRLPGGKADKKSPDDFDPKALAEGEAHEREHTNDPKLAREIAMDHLTEDPHYYEKIKAIEKATS